MNINNIYIDQCGLQSTHVADRVFSHAYTPMGIRQIESNYVYRIRNVDVPIKTCLKRRDCMKIDYYEVDITECNGYNEITIEWENGNRHSFNIGNNSPKNVSADTRMECPDSLREEIQNNPHLHARIKDNLLQNLDCYLARCA